ncbi:Hsp70 family protein [bacterium AH-315-P07]|nr:Hsp70 family protein [bacterium AH-315-P07]
MSDIFCGIDFGTTNSSVAISDGNNIRVLELDPENTNPTSLPSLLYISKDGEQIVGRRAANTFIERNVDREVIVKQVELGIHIQGYVGGEGDNEYGQIQRKDSFDFTEAVTAKAMIEVNSPGRLFQSLKTLLRMKDFHGTEVFGTQYQIEELTAIILRRIKEVADREAGQSVETAVFGRPVRFSTREAENQTAERRLGTAARLAGFKNISFFYEPVGACVEYAMTNEQKQRLLVVDIGGGTFDVCIMEFGGQHGTAARLKHSKILSVSGVPIAGDAIDQEITREKMFPCFGSVARYGPSNLRFPQYLFNTIIDWQNIYKLNTEETINWLIAAESSSDQPETVCALRALIQRNFGYPLARAVETAKIELSELLETHIEFEKPGIHIHEYIERAELTEIIEHMLEKMEESLEEAEKLAGIKPSQIDRILTTGGTSLIPAVREMLTKRYGIDKLHKRDTFTSVAAGLAIVAQHT